MNAQANLFVDSRCELGEGPFWHPLRKRIFWFDILNQTLLSATTDGHLVDRITFKDYVSAAAVVDENTLAVVQSGELLRYDFATDTSSHIDDLDENPANRGNDSRMDRSGGFWIGSMNRGGGGPKTGTVRQWRPGGKVTMLFTGVGVPNSICFSPDGTRAYFTDAGEVIRTATLDPATGLPNSEWTDFVVGGAPGHGDGSVIDSEGYLWNARWGGGCVARFSPDGKLDRIVELPVPFVTCPAFGGDDMKTLYITTAREGMTPADLEQYPLSGSVFSIRVDTPGLPEPFLKL